MRVVIINIPFGNKSAADRIGIDDDAVIVDPPFIGLGVGAGVVVVCVVRVGIPVIHDIPGCCGCGWGGRFCDSPGSWKDKQR